MAWLYVYNDIGVMSLDQSMWGESIRHGGGISFHVYFLNGKCELENKWKRNPVFKSYVSCYTESFVRGAHSRTFHICWDSMTHLLCVATTPDKYWLFHTTSAPDLPDGFPEFFGNRRWQAMNDIIQLVYYSLQQIANKLVMLVNYGK